MRAEIDEETETETWWRARFPVWNPAATYRWALAGGELGYGWVNGLGLAQYDVADADDFVLPLAGAGPDWHLESVVYEIYPDRFARGGVEARARRTGRSSGRGTSCRPAAGRPRRASSSAATCAASSSISTTSKSSARTSST